ncbi:MAG: hypothetical protein FWH59_00765 [Lentimicrobiaceae bacterium]|nr:hypothetical protein [Lentimicrobiaceae bacterium]
MKKNIIILIILLWSCYDISAQKKIVLQSPKMQYVETQLYDEENNYILTLPLTFNMANKNILTVMVGGEGILSNNQSVCFFSNEMTVTDVMKKDKNMKATKTFIKKNSELNVILLPHRKVKLYRSFDDGYEIVKKNAKPVFFEINATPPQPTTFYLQFYVAKTEKKIPYILHAKCKPVEIELIIK